jgi:hypothetical protein
VALRDDRWSRPWREIRRYERAGESGSGKPTAVQIWSFWA